MEPRVVAREFLRAVRGSRSQQAFSQRLGYSSNVVAKWEGGRRAPTAAVVLRACKRVGIDVEAAFTRFRAATAPLLGAMREQDVAAWLAAQRGSQPIGEIAARAAISRYRVSRFLSGDTRPRLPEFCAMVEALTGRLAELIALLVDIEAMPSLLPEYRRTVASRQAAFVQPWSSAVLVLLATQELSAARGTSVAIARTLAISVEVVDECLELLLEAGVVVRRRGRYHVQSALVVDTSSNPSGALALRRHWAGVSQARLAHAESADLFSHQVFCVSRTDYARLRQLQLDVFQQMRAVAVESEPSEVAGLLVMHIVQWDPRLT